MLSACASDDDDDDNGGSSSGGDGTGADGGGDDGSGDGGGDDGGGGELSPECTALCDHTPTATDLEGDCAAITLAQIGGYNFLQQSCVDLAAAFDAGNATVEQCVQCYLDAEVAAEHCSDAEATCFP
jgi:hypothetical protein